MKIIHTADIHLGSDFRGKLGREKREAVKSECRNAFSRLIAFANDNDIKTVLLSGDVFDSDYPLSADRTLFYSAVRENPGITFYYLRGNHDLALHGREVPENLRLFSDEWTYYPVGNGVVIAGIELCEKNIQSRYDSLILDSAGINIVMMHGVLSGSGIDSIDPKRLSGKNVDFLALGHIHTYSSAKIDGRCNAVYPGCLQGRGFDECGQKGFVIYDTDDRTYAFMPFARRIIHELTVDVSGTEDTYSLYRKILNECSFDKNDMLRIILTGSHDENSKLVNCGSCLEGLLSDNCFFASVKDETKLKINIERYRGEMSLRGSFIRSVSEDGELSDEDKELVMLAGLKALEGRRDLFEAD